MFWKNFKADLSCNASLSNRVSCLFTWELNFLDGDEVL